MGMEIRMITKSLNENWSMKEAAAKEWMKAVVPGSVYQDLLLNGKMEDPYYRDNELAALKLMEHDYEYRCSFEAEEELFACDRVLLHFDGLDTITDVFLNGTRILQTNNMHRIWEVDVKELLHQKENEIFILFHSPVNYMREEYQKRPLEGSSDAMVGFPHIRKAHCMFGWDWGPRLPDAGIWRNVSLIGLETARLESVYVRQEHTSDKVTLQFDVAVEKTNSAYETDYEFEVTSPDGKLLTGDSKAPVCIVKNPQLWWPNGYGEQPLYTVKVTLKDGERILDVWERRIGLRTLTVSTQKDEYGEEFAHVVNGLKIFAMGADYIPEDNILGRVTPERTRNLLEQCKAANFNLIRVWGGGYYPYDAFFDICDELGLLVWEDFMFACGVYELTEAFEQNITAEFVDNIRRIRHHASLALWCGNNEMEMFMERELWTKEKKLKADYIKMYEYVIPKVLKQEDPQTFYWPASPSSGGGFDEPNDENRGDVHYWDVWHGNMPITEYRKFFFRYVSEFGFQSFTSLKTVETFTEPEDRNIFSYVMEKHQRNSSANGKIMNYMEQTFLYPNDFDTLLYASQLLQAEAIRYGVEHFRRNRGRCMGAIIWQLNDCWPVASWSSIDYYGRWKALHYYAKRFFAPLMLSCDEESILTQDTNPNAEPYEVKKSIHLSVANESWQEEHVEVSWALRDAKGNVKQEASYDIAAAPFSSVWVPKVELPDAALYEEYVSYEMKKDGAVISDGTVLFCAPKHFRYENPNLRVHVEGDEIVVTADTYAGSVEIINESDDLLLSDNYFDMNGGSRRVKLLKGAPVGLKVRSIYNIR